MNRRGCAAWVLRRRRMQGERHTLIGCEADVRPVRCKDQGIHHPQGQTQATAGVFGWPSSAVATAVSVVGVICAVSKLMRPSAPTVKLPSAG